MFHREIKPVLLSNVCAKIWVCTRSKIQVNSQKHLWKEELHLVKAAKNIKTNNFVHFKVNVRIREERNRRGGGLIKLVKQSFLCRLK